MKKCLVLTLVLLSFLSPFLFIACSSKGNPSTPMETQTSKPEVTNETEEKEGDMPGDSPEAVAIRMPTVPSDSVLHLIPEKNLGLIYCPSLNELDTRINMMAADLLPAAQPPELLASILADTFGAGFETLSELEEIGIDLNRDFAIFFTHLEPLVISATVHLTEPDAMMQVIEMEAEGTSPVEYNGITYWNAAGGSGSFAILNDILVFSQQTTVCENAIDIHKGMAQAITMNADYASLLNDALETDNLITVHLDFESIGPMLSAALKEEMGSMVDSMESNPATMGNSVLFEKMFGMAIGTVEQLKSLGLTLQLEGTDIQIGHFLEFKSESEIQKHLKGMPQELTSLNTLPERAFINGALQMSPDILLQFMTASLKLFAEGPEGKKQLEQFLQISTPLYEALSGTSTFTMNFEDSLIPDYLNVVDLQDEQKVRAYMDEAFLDQLQVSQQLTLGLLSVQAPNLYKDAHAGTPEMHNGVEIKSYLFPNFTEAFQNVPPSVSQIMPQTYNFYYAFHEGQLLQSMGASSQPIKNALDRMSGTGTTLAENPSYQHLAERLGTANNLFLAISPIIAVKGALPLIPITDPNAAAGLQMFEGMLMNLPDNYSIGFAAKARDGGIDAKLLLTLGDFKQFIQMLSRMNVGFN